MGAWVGAAPRCAGPAATVSAMGVDVQRSGQREREGPFALRLDQSWLLDECLGQRDSNQKMQQQVHMCS